MLFAPQPLWARVSNGLLTMAVGAVYFIVVRGAAETLDLLLDVARNLNATRDLVEKQMASRRGKQS